MCSGVTGCEWPYAILIHGMWLINWPRVLRKATMISFDTKMCSGVTDKESGPTQC